MALPQFSEQNILDAFDYIDKNGVPDKNKSTKYEIVLENGKKYPPKYVISVAAYLATGEETDISSYNAVEAKNYFQSRGYTVEVKQEKYELTITADDLVSTDERFRKDNLSLGDNYQPIKAYFMRGETTIERVKQKGERRNTNQTLPRLACQVFEKQLLELPAWDKLNFPICQYAPNKDVIRGLYPSIDEFKKVRNTIEFMSYNNDDGLQFVLYCWNVFSTLIFVQECLKRFGEPGDKFVLIYREKDEKEEQMEEVEQTKVEQLQQESKGYNYEYSKKLIQSKNIIFRGAPGTGKTYLAHTIAADIISDGFEDNFDALSDEQKEQVAFVQFHPNYDYSDFVEGLRPYTDENGNLGFKLQDGIFKKFVKKARENYEASQKSKEVIENELTANEALSEFLAGIEYNQTKFSTITGNEFFISDVRDNDIIVYIPGNATSKTLKVSIQEIKSMLESGESFEKITDITRFFGRQFATQGYSYDFALYKEIKKKMVAASKKAAESVKLKKYIFIIDEINRGEISKILGELFFSIDPGYRGEAGAVFTQYSNLHEDQKEKFYIPDNVYIIGTMNDIDRSVDSFDFAMRRRFRFIEIKADEHTEMLDRLGSEEKKTDAIKKMTALNKAISQVPDLNDNYHIGASYFLKLKTLDEKELWTDCLKPLLQDYVQGMSDENEYMASFEKAYFGKDKSEDVTDEATHD